MELELLIKNNAWYDNGLLTFYFMVKAISNRSDVETELTEGSIKVNIPNRKNFVEELDTEIRENRSNLVINEETDKGAQKEVKKDFIIPQEDKKINGRVALKEILFQDNKRKEFLEKCFEILDKNENGKRNCVVCGRNYSVRGSEIRSKLKLKQTVYPFATKIKSLSGIRTYKNEKYLKFSKTYHDNICPLCYITGVLNWLNPSIIYRTFIETNKGYSFAFIPKSNNLEKLRNFQETYKNVLNNDERYCNVRIHPGEPETENTPGKFSTLLAFYDKFIENTDTFDIDFDWEVLRIPLGNVKNIKKFDISIERGLLEVLQEVIQENTETYEDFVKQVNFFKDNSVDWDITGEIREELAKSFLNDNFKKFAQSMIPRRGGHVGFTSEAEKALKKLLYYWRWEDMNVNEEEINAIEKVGNIVAKTMDKNPSFFYKIDKSKTEEELLDGLREVSRKLVNFDKNDLKSNYISPQALDNLIKLLNKSERDWEEIKNLLVIYSSMQFAKDQFKKGG